MVMEKLLIKWIMLVVTRICKDENLNLQLSRLVNLQQRLLESAYISLTLHQDRKNVLQTICIGLIVNENGFFL